MKRIVITGASRGIGEALARAYAGPDAHLVLGGRDGARLETVAEACRTAAGKVETLLLDIRDRAAVADALRRVDDAGAIDLLVANAGIQMPTREAPGDVAPAHDEVETNLLGTMNTVTPLAERMAARGGGQIGLVSSLAAFTPLPDSPGYSASKAGLLAYGLALRARMRPSGVRVSVLCPGYVDAGMGHRFKGWKPIVVSVEQAAERMKRGLARDQAVVAFPLPLALIARSMQVMPEWLGRMVLGASRFRVEPQAGDRQARPTGDGHG